MPRYSVPDITIENIKNLAKKEYYRLTYNQEGEKIRPGITSVNILTELFIEEILKVYERNMSK